MDNAIEYQKIQTVFLRDPEANFKRLREGQFAKPEFEFLQALEWLWTEKIDGANIRVMWDGEAVRFGGKTDRANIPATLVARLQDLFTPDKFRASFDDGAPVCLYGEGFGAGIQRGGAYIPDGVDFILFDVRVGDVWLEWTNVCDVARKLDIRAVPVVGAGPLLGAVECARGGLASTIGTAQAEGLVMRPAVTLCDRFGKRILAKIKTRDFA